MEHAFDDTASGLIKHEDRETIELELTQLQIRSLAEIGPGQSSAAPLRAEGSFIGRRPGKVLVAVSAAVVALLGGIAYLTAEPARSVATAVIPVHAPAPLPSVEPLTAQEEPVRFANPFDRREVFEFPAGTTRTAARDAVAEMLVQRARDRGVSAVENGRRNRTTAARNAAGAGHGEPN